MYTLAMTDQSAPVFSLSNTAGDARTLLFELSDKARYFGINPDRPFFPANSMRLLYFMILDHMTGSSEAVETMSKVIIKVDALESINPSDVEKLLTFTQQLNQHPQPSTEVLLQLLDLRALDSVIFSTLLCELIWKYGVQTFSSQEKIKLATFFDGQVHLISQLNDLVDSLIFAKNDVKVEDSAVTPMMLIQAMTRTPDEAKLLFQSCIAQLLAFAQQLSFSPELDALFLQFRTTLVAVVH